MSEATVVAPVTGKGKGKSKGKGKHTGPKNPNVPLERFVQVYFAGVNASKSNADIAKELGMKVSSFSVRLSNVKKQFAKAEEAAKAENKEVHNPFSDLSGRRGNAKADIYGEGGLLAKLGMLGGDKKVESTEETPAGEPVAS